MKKTRTALALVFATMLAVCASIFVLAACGEEPEPKTLDSIAITAQPAKTVYIEGDTFDAAGMTVTAKYSDGSEEAVTDYTISPSGALSVGTTGVSVSYKYEGITKKATVNITVKAWDTDIPEDTGTLADHVYEAEAAAYVGVSSNNGNNFGHACVGKSYFFDASLGGGLCIRNVSPKADENNNITFAFTSDKAVKAKMEIAVASRYNNDKWVATNFNNMFETTVNGRTLTETVEVPAATAADKIQNNNYACIKVVELPVTIVEGANTVVFKALAQACNLDYINVKTSANLTDWENHYWANADDVVEITQKPTATATGTIKFLCSGEVPADDHAATFTMPKLDDPFYTQNEDETYSFTLMGKTFTVDGEASPEPEPPAAPTAPEANYIEIYDVSKWNSEGNELNNKITPVEVEEGVVKIVGHEDKVGAAKIDCLSVGGKNPVHGDSAADCAGKTFVYSVNVKADGNFNLFLYATNKKDTHTNYNDFRAVRLEFVNGKIALGFNGDGKGDNGTQAESGNAYDFTELKRVDIAITRVDASAVQLVIFIDGEVVTFENGTPTKVFGSVMDGHYGYNFTAAGFGTRLLVSPAAGSTVYLTKNDTITENGDNEGGENPPTDPTNPDEGGDNEGGENPPTDPTNPDEGGENPPTDPTNPDEGGDNEGGENPPTDPTNPDEGGDTTETEQQA